MCTSNDHHLILRFNQSKQCERQTCLLHRAPGFQDCPLSTCISCSHIYLCVLTSVSVFSLTRLPPFFTPVGALTNSLKTYLKGTMVLRSPGPPRALFEDLLLGGTSPYQNHSRLSSICVLLCIFPMPKSEVFPFCP